MITKWFMILFLGPVVWHRATHLYSAWGAVPTGAPSVWAQVHSLPDSRGERAFPKPHVVLLADTGGEGPCPLIWGLAATGPCPVPQVAQGHGTAYGPLCIPSPLAMSLVWGADSHAGLVPMLHMY